MQTFLALSFIAFLGHAMRTPTQCAVVTWLTFITYHRSLIKRLHFGGLSGGADFGLLLLIGGVDVVLLF